MAKIQLKRNDVVIVRKGKDRGKTGKVLKIFPETNRVIVERVHFSKHFVKADRSKNVQGGVMEKETPIPIANVMLFCSDCGQGVRVRSRRHEDGTSSRVCAKCDSVIEKSK